MTHKTLRGTSHLGDESPQVRQRRLSPSAACRNEQKKQKEETKHVPGSRSRWCVLLKWQICICSGFFFLFLFFFLHGRARELLLEVCCNPGGQTERRDQSRKWMREGKKKIRAGSRCMCVFAKGKKHQCRQRFGDAVTWKVLRRASQGRDKTLPPPPRNVLCPLQSKCTNLLSRRFPICRGTRRID